MQDIAAQMKTAQPVAVAVDQEAWLAARGSPANAAPPGGHQKPRSGASGGEQAGGADMAVLPVQLPELPKGFVARATVLQKAKAALGAVSGGDAPAGAAAAQGRVPKLVLQGMVRTVCGCAHYSLRQCW